MDQLGREIDSAEKKFGKKGTKVIVRWHDAGDFFSPQYLNLAFEAARKHPDVDFYAYTKMADVAQSKKPSNFIINFSMGALASQEKKINFEKTKHSKVVPKEVFSDLVKRVEVDTGKKKKGEPVKEKKLVYKSDQDIDTLKQRLAAKYSIDPKTILTYDEMMSTPVGKKNRYNVIVKPGDGDDSANRRDVLGTYLLIH
jgi:hypothetical protein